MALPEAVVRVVTGQMHSSKAAHSIYQRVRGRADERERNRKDPLVWRAATSGTFARRMRGQRASAGGVVPLQHPNFLCRGGGSPSQACIFALFCPYAGPYLSYPATSSALIFLERTHWADKRTVENRRNNQLEVNRILV